MARINCEDDYWTDPRREALGLLIGDQEKADGRMLRAWRVSQSHWTQGHLVPHSLWNAAKLDGIIECGLAERREDGVYCKGSASHFDWIPPKAKAGRAGGIASVAARKERDGTAIPVNARNRSRPNAASVNAPKHPEADRSTTEASALLCSARIVLEEDIPPPPDPGDLDLATRWAEFACSVSRTVKPDPERWANTVRLMREKDGLTHADLDAMLAFVKSDHFWQHNAASLEGLRSRSKNGLRKCENILNAARGAKPVAKPKPAIPIFTKDDRDKLLGE